MTSTWMALWTMMMACGSAGASDVWLDVTATDGPETVALHLPANWIADEADATVDTRAGRVDLAAEVRDLRGRRAGLERRYELVEDDGDVVPLVLRTTGDTGTTSSLAVGILGPRGNGMTLSFALDDPGQTRSAGESLSAAVEIDGLEVKIDDPFVAQLRRSPPTVLLETTGKKGGGLKIESR